MVTPPSSADMLRDWIMCSRLSSSDWPNIRWALLRSFFASNDSAMSLKNWNLCCRTRHSTFSSNEAAAVDVVVVAVVVGRISGIFLPHNCRRSGNECRDERP